MSARFRQVSVEFDEKMKVAASGGCLSNPHGKSPGGNSHSSPSRDVANILGSPVSTAKPAPRTVHPQTPVLKGRVAVLGGRSTDRENFATDDVVQALMELPLSPFRSPLRDTFGVGSLTPAFFSRSPWSGALSGPNSPFTGFASALSPIYMRTPGGAMHHNDEGTQMRKYSQEFEPVPINVREATMGEHSPLSTPDPKLTKGFAQKLAYGYAIGSASPSMNNTTVLSPQLLSFRSPGFELNAQLSEGTIKGSAPGRRPMAHRVVSVSDINPEATFQSPLSRNARAVKEKALHNNTSMTTDIDLSSPHSLWSTLLGNISRENEQKSAEKELEVDAALDRLDDLTLVLGRSCAKGKGKRRTASDSEACINETVRGVNDGICEGHKRRRSCSTLSEMSVQPCTPDAKHVAFSTQGGIRSRSDSFCSSHDGGGREKVLGTTVGSVQRLPVPKSLLNAARVDSPRASSISLLSLMSGYTKPSVGPVAGGTLEMKPTVPLARTLSNASVVQSSPEVTSFNSRRPGLRAHPLTSRHGNLDSIYSVVSDVSDDNMASPDVCYEKKTAKRGLQLPVSFIDGILHVSLCVCHVTSG